MTTLKQGDLIKDRDGSMPLCNYGSECKAIRHFHTCQKSIEMDDYYEQIMAYKKLGWFKKLLTFRPVKPH